MGGAFRGDVLNWSHGAEAMKDTDVGDHMSAAVTYQEQIKLVMGAAGWSWPKHVLLDPAKQPRFVSSVDELWREMQSGCHLNKVIVFPGGVKAVGQQDAMDLQIRDALGFSLGADESCEAKSAYEVLERLESTDALDRLKAKIMYRHTDASDKKTRSAGGSGNSVLRPKWNALREDSMDVDKSSVYIAEIRQVKPQECDDGLRRKRKSSMMTTLRERLYRHGRDVQKMLFWDDYSEGFFVGGHLSAYDLHVDCIPSSNVGSVLSGHKCLAIWGIGSDTSEVMGKHGRELFAPPLTDYQVAALERASCVVMAPPGSITVFSGAQAHTVLNVGFTSATSTSVPRPCLCVSSYEAFASLNQEHAKVLLKACDDASDSDDDMADFEEEVGESIAGYLVRLEEVPEDSSEARLARSMAEFVMNANSRIRNATKKEIKRMTD